MIRVYGTSDDLIEIEGHLNEEFCLYGTSEKTPFGLSFSDGTIIAMWYGKPSLAIWAISVLREGTEFKEFKICNDEDISPYSDELILGDNIHWVIAGKITGKIGKFIYGT